MIYQDFAYIYDQMVGNQFFKIWQDYFEKLVKRFEIKYEIVADVACGTGNMVKYWANKGKKVYGIDNSLDMLKIAQEKNYGNGAIFLRQDFTQLSLPEPVDLITSNFDSLNYLTIKNDLAEALRRFYLNLKPQGYVIFDLNSIWHLRRNWGSRTTFYKLEDIYAIWITKWDEKKSLSTLKMYNFLKQPNGLYQMHYEVHFEKGYEVDEVIDILKRVGFLQVHCFDLETLGSLKKNTARLLFLAKKDNF